MRRSQLTQWIIVVSLAACTSDPVRPAASFGPGSTVAGGVGGSAGGGTSHPDGATTAGSSGAAGGRTDDASIGDGATDSAYVRRDVMVRQEEAGPVQCSNDRAALGSSTLLAAGATPAAFAQAFNAELLSLPTPGPLLMIFSGVNAGSLATKTASLGALTLAPGGVDFDGSHADVPFSVDGMGVLKIAKSDAAFGIRFIPPASDVMIPVASVELTGTLENGCVSFTIASLKLFVPATAASVAFHGSTVGALMGSPTAGVQGGSNNAWPLELAGDVVQVNAVLNEDAGAEVP